MESCPTGQSRFAESVVSLVDEPSLRPKSRNVIGQSPTQDGTLQPGFLTKLCILHVEVDGGKRILAQVSWDSCRCGVVYPIKAHISVGKPGRFRASSSTLLEKEAMPAAQLVQQLTRGDRTTKSELAS